MPISPARAAAFDILLRIGEQDAFASELLHSERLAPLSPADRGLCMEIVMGVLRWRSRLDEAIAQFCFTPFRKLDAAVLAALRIGAYQLMFLDRIPARAAVNESVEMVKVSKKTSAAPLINAVLRKIASSRRGSFGQDTVESGTSSPATLAHAFAHPEWLVARWVREYGAERAERICRFDQCVPATTLRLSDSEAEQELRAEGIELAPGTLMATARRVVVGDVTRTQAYAEGRVFVQDEGSQLIALLVGHGQRILDCCAAPGGKTAALAARNPQAEIVAAELHEHRVRLLERLVRTPNVRIIQADATKLPLEGVFDRVLADVPCSGTGTLARNPEIKWKLKPEDLPDLHARQVAILTAALEKVAPGGRLIYSSCSLEREENEEVVEEVLRARKDFHLLECGVELERLKGEGLLTWPEPASLTQGSFLHTFPGIHPCDGFFAAILEKV